MSIKFEILKTNNTNIYLAIDDLSKATTPDKAIMFYIEVNGDGIPQGIVPLDKIVELKIEITQKLRSDSKIYQPLQDFANRQFKLTNRTLIDTINGYEVFLDKSDLKMKIDIAGELIDIEDEKVIASLKEQSTTLQRVKISIPSSSIGLSSLGERVLLYGPTGTGKTYTFLSSVNQLIASGQLDDFEILAVGEGFEDVDFFQIININNGKVSQKERALVQKLRDAANGKRLAFCIDELNRGSKSFTNLVLKMLDSVNGEFYSIYYSANDEYINIPIMNILWFATVNIGGKYSGTNVIDEALFDRFSIVYNHTYSNEVETSMIEMFGDEYKNHATDIIKYVRDLYTSGDIRAPISTRGIKNWVEKFINSDKSLKAFNDTFELSTLYRLCSVDDYGNSNEQEKILILSKFKDLGLI